MLHIGTEPPARDDDDVSDGGAGARGREAGVAVVPLAERRLEVPATRRARPPGRPGSSSAGSTTAAWADIRVPGNWELQGFGMPIYSNSRYPFAYDARNPRAQRNDNPVGSYRTRFEVPPDWAGAACCCTSPAWTPPSTSG